MKTRFYDTYFCRIVFFIIVPAMVGCSHRNSSDTLHILNGIEFDSLRDSTLSPTGLQSYMAARSIRGSKWVNNIEDRWFIFSPVFICGIPGVLEVYSKWPLDSKNQHWGHLWRCQTIDLLSSTVDNAPPYLREIPLAWADDTVFERSWTHQVFDNWPKKRIFDTLISRMGLDSVVHVSAAPLSPFGFVSIEKDSVITIWF
jgi:hypothetical protein